jgi:lipoate-protein ligase A
MATDEAIWRAVVEGFVPPTLRLYAWQPPCLSLGRHQPVAEVDREALRRAGYDLVRRPTGGRAILHTDELTYSVSIPLTDPRVEGGILASCESLSQGLLWAVREELGGDVAINRRDGGASSQEAVCFETPADFEIVAGGRKLIGSAQMRARGALLQHGTLPLKGDIARICSFLVVSPDPDRVRERAATLERVSGRSMAWGDAAQAVAKGFAQALNLRLELGELTRREKINISRLHQQKYSARDWTERI